jgi:hypothetical protein
MARCPNKNTAEYKALQEVYVSELKTNNIINAWQSANSTDAFPTTAEADNFIKTNKAAFSLKQRQFGESVIHNLRRKKLIHLYEGNYVINNSYDDSMVYDASALAAKHKAVLLYLKTNNIPKESYHIIKTAQSYKIEILDNMFTPKDILESSRAWDTPRSREVVTHLMRMFPQLKVQMLSVKEAKAIHDTLPKWKKTSGPFSEVNSFYVDGVVYLIKGKVTNETLIEEMLHPFIDAIKMDNEVLFNSLLAEAKVNFPEMVQQITDAYNKDRNFNQLDRDLEIVTQALTRHFNKEYNGVKPTRTFLNLIEDALEWLQNVINNLHEYIAGTPLLVTAINSNATFSDIAKLLNTADLEFTLVKRASPKVRYSLSPAKQSIVDGALSKANGIQTEVVNKMFHLASTSKETVDSLSVNLKSAEETGTIVVLNEEDHTYIDITNNKVFTSATTAIKGKLTNKEGEAIIAKDKAIKGLKGKELAAKKKEWTQKIKEGKILDAEKLADVQLNLDIGNDIDTIVESIVTTLNGSTINTFESTLAAMKILDPEQTREMFGAMRVVISDLMPEGSIAMSQVVVFDEATQLAGTADLVIIDRNGRINILDLKTSKNSINKKFPVYTKQGRQGLKIYEDKKWTLPADSLLKQKGVDTLSTKGQHNLQVNMYRRMFENMGYTVNEGDFSASTFHIKLDIKGNGKDQKYLGTWSYEKAVHHTETKVSENGVYVDMLIPSTKVNTNKEKLDAKTSNKEDSPYIGREDPLVQGEVIPETVEPKVLSEKNTIYDAIQSYTAALEAAQDADTNNKKKVFSNRTYEQRLDDRANEQAYIQNGMNKGPLEQSRVYTALLRKSLEKIRDFTEYVSDPRNINDPEYIGYVLNFNRFLSTFGPLYAIKDSADLNATQRQLVLNLQLEVNKLVGAKALNTGKEGIINDAIFNYVKEVVRNTSNRQYGIEGSGFTEEDLIKELTQVDDISGIDLQTRDLATSSDTLLAIVDKIYKRQKQILLDKINYRESVIQKAGNKLLKLSPGMSRDQIYDFMHVFKEGKRTGFYTKPIGQKYYALHQELRDATTDSKGVPLQYRDITNLEDASQEDIDYNIEVANKKRAFSSFSQAERSDENGNRIDGKYHKYNQEFQTARKKFEFWQNNGTYGAWHKRSRVNEVEYQKYQAKYYNLVDFNKALRGPNGQPTGAVKRNEPGNFVKPEYKEINQFAIDENGFPEQNGDMRSEQYKAIFDPLKTDALSLAQREFYELYVKYYETELLAKLPQSVRGQMEGRIPLVKSQLLSDLKSKSNVFVRMYSSTVRSVQNLVTETAVQKSVLLDEQGNFVNSMPIGYVGSPRVEGALEEAQARQQILKTKYKKGEINGVTYKKEAALIAGEIAKLRVTPLVEELSSDLATSLIKFSAMAEHYEVMGEIEDTLTAITRVVENRSYEPSKKSTRLVGRATNKIDQTIGGTVGFKKENSGDSNTVRRLRKYLSMVYYDNELITKGAVDKIADKLIGFSSLAYVAFNPFGNFNNYLMGRINNNIEMLGSKFYTKKNYMRASKEYNTVALPGIIKRTGSGIQDIADIATLGLAGIGKTDYDPNLANNKYEALVDLFRMMDDSTDIRESQRDTDDRTIWERFKAWGYIMQDSAEYNVQTKVGIALIMDSNILNKETGETMSLYDAFQFNGKSHKVTLMDGFTTIISKDGKEIAEYNDDFRYKLRNNIREVNKQIHGNYAAEDRMIIQSHTLGNLAAQFKKWVAPAVRARFQPEYFDENLGWMEGRYKSAWQFAAYAKQQIVLGNRDFKNYSKGFLKEQEDYDGTGGLGDSRGKNKLFGVYRTLGEIAIITLVAGIGTILDSVLAGDDDDSDTERRLKNLTKYQADRLYKELILFAPVTPDSWVQIQQMVKSPIAASRMLGELGEAVNLSVWSPAMYVFKSQEEFYADSDFVYQNKPHKGRLKVAKAWEDALPILTSLKKWENAIIEKEFKY